jgi:DTW domain-containing protein YfiP
MALTPRTFDHSRCTPRQICPGCGRPARVCYCPQVEPISTRTRVLILQHPRERKVGVNTARIARLCLPNSEFCRGVDFSEDPTVRAALSDPNRPAVLLFPGPQSADLRELAPGGPVTLVVLDGTWWQASKLLRKNPAIASLPRYAFEPAQPSRYRIRGEPQENYVATIEALAEALGVLEGAPERMARLLLPFDAMVEHQLAIERDNPNPRRKPKPPKPRKSIIPAALRERATDLVLAGGEANAWPRGSQGSAAELVHWVALRVQTGERFEAVIRPRNELAPACAYHIKLERDRILCGEPFDSFAQRWREFLRPGELLCTWGKYAADLASDQGVPLGERLDVRPSTLRYLGLRAGACAECVNQLGLEPAAIRASGRAGLRLAELEAIVRYLATPESP